MFICHVGAAVLCTLFPLEDHHSVAVDEWAGDCDGCLLRPVDCQFVGAGLPQAAVPERKAEDPLNDQYHAQLNSNWSSHNFTRRCAALIRVSSHSRSCAV